MAARNHFVPQFLLRRFASKKPAKASFVWVFERTGEIEEMSTNRTAWHWDFYGEEANGVETGLRSYESQHARTLLRIDAGNSVQDYQEEMRQLVWMLAVRTRALRRQYAAAVSRLLDHYEAHANTEPARTAASRHIRHILPEVLTNAFAKLPPAYGKRAQELLVNPERYKALENTLAAQIDALDMQSFMMWVRQATNLGGKLARSAATGQITALEQFLKAPQPPASFSPALWHVERRPKGTFVLGDSCVFATDKNGNASALLAHMRDWQGIYLPISDQSVLIASRRDGIELMSDEDINRASVRLSDQAFYACRRTAREEMYVEEIGRGVPIMTDEELSAIVLKCFRELAEKPPAIHATCPPSPVRHSGDTTSG